MKNQPGYYQKVGVYYDGDASNFESRYHENPILQKIRSSFRKEADRYAHGNILEIGYGPGLDLLYFAEKHPGSKVFGIDISQGMYHCAMENITKKGLKNVEIHVGSVEQIPELWKDQKFDFAYVFFGALNTVEDLNEAAAILHRCLSENGVLLVTFVNKWYMKGLLAPMLKLKFKTATARLRKIWGGYSPSVFLPSKCYSIAEVKKAFRLFHIQAIRGYSILYPAWYDSHKYTHSNKLDLLWQLDEQYGKSFARGWGEYSLFVFRKHL